MNLFKQSNVINVEGKRITDIEFLSRRLCMPRSNIETYNNWYLMNDKLYYFKAFNSYDILLKELIGERLCKLFSLPCIHNEIAYNGSCYGLLSESFYEDKKEYISSEDLDLHTKNVFETLEYMYQIGAKDELIKNIKKMIVMDLYMMQTDRDNNLNYIKENNTLSMGPLFDFEKSYVRNYPYYFSFVYGYHLDKDKEKLQSDELLMKLFKFADNIDIKDVISYISKSMRFYVPDSCYEYFDLKSSVTKENVRKRILVA